MRFISGYAEQIKHRLLHVRAVNTYGTAADLGTVKHHVVGFRQRLFGRLLHGFQSTGRRRERMMQRIQPLRFIVVFEHRKVHHPQRLPAWFEQFQIAPELQAHCTHKRIHLCLGAGAEQQQIACLRLCRCL